MKRKILFTFLFIPFLLASCGTDNNYGYPSKMTFENEGGTRLCSGTSGCYSIEINNYNGDGTSSIASGLDSIDSIKVTYNWLTVKCKRSTSSQLEMTAAPNPSRKKRTLYAYPWIDDTFAEIKVVQY